MYVQTFLTYLTDSLINANFDLLLYWTTWYWSNPVPYPIKNIIRVILRGTGLNHSR